jgi:alkaline phosphatase D
MIRAFTAFAALALTACVQAPPADPVAALAPFVASVRDLPQAPPGAPLPGADAVISAIAFGSCQTAEKPVPILDRMVADRPQLAVFMGDNVYGDAIAGDMALPELRAQYEKLAGSREFQRLRAVVPTLATWDDHDFGLNDAGGDFSGKLLAKRIFESFWGVRARTETRDGIYDAYMFGPEGRRLQVILLDTRYGRTPLNRLPQGDPRGRYAPTDDPGQRMLSDAQWAWLAAQLAQPADVRFLVSSIQVLADGHGWEAWRMMPREQARLFETLRASGAKGVVLVSGDRHIAGLYRQEGVLGYPLHELTTSSLNLSYRDASDERSTAQLGDMYAPVNYGMALIDWSARRLALQVRGADGAIVREQAVALADLGG